MTAPLEEPRSADDLYLARSAEAGGVPVSVYRPIITGDVFRSVDIPGVGHQDGDQERLAIVVSHPCSMRNGSRIKDHVQALRVVKAEPIKLEEWPKRYYDRMPLPDLTVVIDPDDVSGDDPEADLAARTDEGAHAALFEFRGCVKTEELHLDKRIASLTDQGIAFLHQRMAHDETRYAPSVDELVTVCAPVFAEIELWEQWNERLVDPSALSDPQKLQEELDRVGDLFDAELSQKRPTGKKNGWYKLRNDLSIPKLHHKARREILRLLDEQVKPIPCAG